MILSQGIEALIVHEVSVECSSERFTTRKFVSIWFDYWFVWKKEEQCDF